MLPWLLVEVPLCKLFGVKWGVAFDSVPEEKVC